MKLKELLCKNVLTTIISLDVASIKNVMLIKLAWMCYYKVKATTDASMNVLKT